MTSNTMDRTDLIKSLNRVSTPGPAGFREIRPADVARLGSDVRVVDVRGMDEVTGPLGAITGVEVAPLPELAQHAVEWNPEEPIVVVCRSGGRSGRAAATLRASGFTHVYNMTGGMLAWHEAGLPKGHHGVVH